MKKILFLLAIFLIVSCSSDDSDNVVSLKITSFNIQQDSNQLIFSYTANEEVLYYEITYDYTSNHYNPNNNGSNGNGFTTSDLNSTQKSIQELHLNPSDSFMFYIRAIGNNNVRSEWFGPKVLSISNFCEAPYNVVFSGYVSWDTYYNQTSSSYFQVQYGLQGFEVGTGTTIQTSDHSTVYTSGLVLDQGNVYDAYVRSFCNNSLGWSNWVGPISYFAENNTNVCVVPDNLGYYTEHNWLGEPVGANISWNDSGHNGAYEFNLVGNGQSPESSAIETRDDGGTQITYTGLTPGYQYHFYVRTVCADGTRTAWAGPLGVIIY